MQGRLRSLVGLSAVVVMAALGCASNAMADATVLGPTYPLPGFSVPQSHGGSSCKQTGGITTGNLVWSFGSNPSTAGPEMGNTCGDTTTPPAFDPTRLQALYWGLDLTSPNNNYVSATCVNFGCSAAQYDSGPMAYDATDSTPASGVLVYQGKTTSSIHLTLTFKDGSGNPVALTAANTIGSFSNSSVDPSAVGYVLAVTPQVTNFTVSAAYNIGIPSGNCACHTETHISGGFYYVDLPPSGSITPTATPANHTPATFQATGLTDPYSIDDGGATPIYSWDMTGGTTYTQFVNQDATGTFGPGDHTVALLLTDPDGLSTRVAYPFGIVNQNPTGTISTNPDTPLNHQSVTFSIPNAADPDRGTDGTCTAPTWAWDLTGGENYTTSDASPSATFGPGPHTVAALITDCDGGTTRVTKDFTITDANPTVSFSCLPAKPFAKQFVTCTATDSDPDAVSGDPPLTEAWTVGTTHHAGHTFTFTQPPGAHLVSLAVTDRDNGKTTVSHNVVFTKPVATVVITPRQHLTTAVRSGIKATFKTNEAFTSALSLKVSKATSKAGKPITVSGIVATARPKATKAGSVAFTLVLSATAKHKLAQAKSATFSLAGTARDKFGNAVPVHVNFTLS